MKWMIQFAIHDDGSVWLEQQVQSPAFLAKNGERNGAEAGKVRWWVLMYDEATGAITNVTKETSS
jgi:hypothetical protein